MAPFPLSHIGSPPVPTLPPSQATLPSLFLPLDLACWCFGSKGLISLAFNRLLQLFYLGYGKSGSRDWISGLS